MLIFCRSDRGGAVVSFLNPRLNGKPRVVHLNCTLMAHRMCGEAGESVKESIMGHCKVIEDMLNEVYLKRKGGWH